MTWYIINQIELNHTFSNLVLDTCDSFDKVFLEILSKHALLKGKLLRAKAPTGGVLWKSVFLKRKEINFLTT